jgi:hypothetical protein
MKGVKLSNTPDTAGLCIGSDKLEGNLSFPTEIDHMFRSTGVTIPENANQVLWVSLCFIEHHFVSYHSCLSAINRPVGRIAAD